MSTVILPPPSQTPARTQTAAVARVPRSGLAPAEPPFPVYRVSVEQYHVMIDHGILDTDDRTELLEGWIVAKMTQHPPHYRTIKRSDRAISKRLPDDWHTRAQGPITTADSEPEPDLAVVRGEDEDAYPDRHPGPSDVGTMIEVADSSLKLDRRLKATLYARAAIPIYWIVNLPEEQVEVYSNPTGPADAPRYQTLATYLRGDFVPLVLDGVEIAQIPVDELLP